MNRIELTVPWDPHRTSENRRLYCLWSEEEDATLRRLYSTHTRVQIAELLERSKSSVRARCWTLGLNTKHGKPWTGEEIEIIRQHYAERAGKPLELAGLAVRLGRAKSVVCAKAKKIGAGTDQRRPYAGERASCNARRTSRTPKHATEAERRAASSARMKAYIAANGHPRGMRGQKHTELTRARLGESSSAMWQRMTSEQREQRALKRNATVLERYGSGRTAGPESNPYSRCRGGRRADLDGRYFRSSWEANYARYLNWLISLGEVARWEYEPETFVFDGVKRGALSYTPDFLVVYPTGDQEYHEVKGWMTSDARTRLERMASYYPEVRIVLIDSDRYRRIARNAPMIAGWESPGDERDAGDVAAVGAPKCRVNDCDRGTLARGLCSRHYQQAQKALKGAR